jgi:hypothetical protein
MVSSLLVLHGSVSYTWEEERLVRDHLDIAQFLRSAYLQLYGKSGQQHAKPYH